MRAFAIVKCTYDAWIEVREQFLAAYPSLDVAFDQAVTTFGAKFDCLEGGLPYRSITDELTGSWIEIQYCKITDEYEFEGSVGSLYDEVD